ncbi:MAG: Tetratricopeptide repeat [Candidatus Sumerlaeota bacterium]|nr:Tetratricopeptide repeat [Candidatus Sumerlaeota bacterium]
MVRKVLTWVLMWTPLAGAGVCTWLLLRFFNVEAFRSEIMSTYAMTEGDFAIWFLYVAAGMGAAVLLGYLVSLDPRAPRRPWASLIAGPFGAGWIAGAALYCLAYERTDALFWAAAAGVGAGTTAIILGIELANRWLWQSIVRKLDEKNLGGAALLFSRLALLWRPGQEALLLSVSMERFRRGARGDAAEHLRATYRDGNRSPDLLELLCQLANEEKQPREFLQYLKDLFEQFPEDEQLRDAYLHELMEQGQNTEALAVIEERGMREDEESLERLGSLLIDAGRFDRAVETAARLGELEGIPMRRADALLRRILSANEDHLDAVNLLAEWAERMGRRDQLIRWLDRSITIAPRQLDRSLKLAGLLEEAGMTHRLEELLESLVNDRPGDYELGLRYAKVVYGNGKLPEAAEYLERQRGRGCDDPELYQLLGKTLFELEKWDEAKAIVDEGVTKLKGDDKQALTALQKKIERALLTTELAEMIERSQEDRGNIALQFDVLHRLVSTGHAERAVGHADAILHHHPDKRPEVISEMRKAVEEMKEGGFPLLNYLADLQVAESDYDEALETVKLMAERSLNPAAAIRDGAQKILRRSPHHLLTLRTMGELYRNLGQFTEMIHAFSLYLANGGEESEEMDRSLVDAYIALNDYHNLKRFVNSLLASSTGAETETKNKQMLQRVIPLAVESGNAIEAAEYQKRLEMMDPANRETRKLRARVDEALGKQRFAFLKREIEAGKGDGNTLEELGDLCVSQEDFNQAITYYQRAARQAGANRIPRAKLAYAFAKKRMFDLAGETLGEMSLNIDDDPEELEALMTWLYNTAEVLEESHMFERASRLFKQLMKIDAGYKDVLQRVERLSRK